MHSIVKLILFSDHAPFSRTIDMRLHAKPHCHLSQLLLAHAIPNIYINHTKIKYSTTKYGIIEHFCNHTHTRLTKEPKNHSCIIAQFSSFVLGIVNKCYGLMKSISNVLPVHAIRTFPQINEELHTRKSKYFSCKHEK